MATLVAIKTINARELRNDYARILREVEGGESYTVTNRGNAVAQIGPLPSPRPGRTEAVTFGAVAGALAHLGSSASAELHGQLAARLDGDLQDPFDRGRR